MRIMNQVYPPMRHLHPIVVRSHPYTFFPFAIFT